MPLTMSWKVHYVVRSTGDTITDNVFFFSELSAGLEKAYYISQTMSVDEKMYIYLYILYYYFILLYIIIGLLYIPVGLYGGL